MVFSQSIALSSQLSPQSGWGGEKQSCSYHHEILSAVASIDTTTFQAAINVLSSLWPFSSFQWATKEKHWELGEMCYRHVKSQRRLADFWKMFLSMSKSFPDQVRLGRVGMGKWMVRIRQKEQPWGGIRSTGRGLRAHLVWMRRWGAGESWRETNGAPTVSRPGKEFGHWETLSKA